MRKDAFALARQRHLEKKDLRRRLSVLMCLSNHLRRNLEPKVWKKTRLVMVGTNFKVTCYHPSTLVEVMLSLDGNIFSLKATLDNHFRQDSASSTQPDLRLVNLYPDR